MLKGHAPQPHAERHPRYSLILARIQAANKKAATVVVAAYFATIFAAFLEQLSSVTAPACRTFAHQAMVSD